MGAFRIRWFNLLVTAMVLAGCAAARAQMPSYHLGRAPSAEEIRAWDTTVSPDGKDLPPGRGTAKDGAKIYAQKCAGCHGPTGTEAKFFLGRLVGKGTVAEWSFAPSIWDFINRAMPLKTIVPDHIREVKQEGSLKPDEVYALTAFLLFRNGIIQENDVMDRESLPKIKMPNR